MEGLGPFGLAAVIDLLDGLVLGSHGIHLIVTDRAEAVRAELEARCPEGWVVEELFAPERDRLCGAAYREDGKQRLLVGALDPRRVSDQAAVRALNTDREWLLREGLCAVVLVEGKDAVDADASHLELQARAPDFWSVRSRVHRAVGQGAAHGAFEAMLELLTPIFGGDRPAAVRWFVGRPVLDDWITFKLWRDGPLRSSWFDLASRAPRSSEHTEHEPSQQRALVRVHRLDFDPIGNEIARECWPRPSWPSGHLDSMQAALISALQSKLERTGEARLHHLIEDSSSETLRTTLLSLGLMQEHRFDLTVHLDARAGLSNAINRRLREAGDDGRDMGLIDGARRLHGALGPTNVLLLITDAPEVELELVAAILPGRTIAATVHASLRSTFCVCGTEHEDVEWATAHLSAWGAGAIEQRVELSTTPLDLRAGLARADYAIVLADDRWSEISEGAWRAIEAASDRIAGFMRQEPGSSRALDVRWIRGVLESHEDSALERLLRTARSLVGEPRIVPLGLAARRPAAARRDDRRVRRSGPPLGDPVGKAQWFVNLGRKYRNGSSTPLFVEMLFSLGAELVASGLRRHAVGVFSDGLRLLTALYEHAPHTFDVDRFTLTTKLWRAYGSVGLPVPEELVRLLPRSPTS
ncbi:MAG: hypothetical protein AB1Z98_38090 [Nannocystaceae bacterium]